MDRKRNFLLGNGEKLTQTIPPPGGGGPKAHPYQFEEAVSRLAAKATKLADGLISLPSQACPNDEAVAILTLHPSYLAKSYFPDSLLTYHKFRSVGSRSRIVTPEKWTKITPVEPTPTIDLFVAASRKNLVEFCNSISGLKHAAISRDIIRIEDIRYFEPSERVKSFKHNEGNVKLEIALHANYTKKYIVDAFKRYVDSLGADIDLDRSVEAKGLLFIPGSSSFEHIKDIERFSYLRVIREMPSLREFTPYSNDFEGTSGFSYKLPTSKAVNPNVKVAIFDGGIHADIGDKLDLWVTRKKGEGASTATENGKHHGTAVTSAFLFGPIEDGTKLQTPFANVDHYRVIDENTGKSDDLFDVLQRIKKVLNKGKYEFFNISVGPDLPVDDDDVEVWTSTLDDILANGKMLGMIAAGNTGESDSELMLNRVLVPSDCVNGMAIGACDRRASKGWKRAPYSSVGPGRSPGVVKPDVVGFGGSDSDPYYVVSPLNPSKTIPIMGTSFSAPTALRLAAGIRSHFGPTLTPLSIKALLINKSTNENHPQSEVGWGRIVDNIEDIVICDDNTATVVYQDYLDSKQYIRASLPIPNTITGTVTITATICYTTEIDPQDVSSYTMSGIEVTFRPNDTKYNEGANQPKTDPSFFSKSKIFTTESELRDDFHKWETVIHKSGNKRASSLSNPVFELHYHARECCADIKRKLKIPYSMVITIKGNDNELYEKVHRHYMHILQPIMPTIEISVSV